MSEWREYGLGQRLTFYAVALGLLTCFIACASPFWFTGQVSRDESCINKVFHDNVPHTEERVGKSVDLNISVGLWWYCVSTSTSTYDKRCFYLPAHNEIYQENFELREVPRLNEYPRYLVFLRSLMVACLITALVGLLMVCFYCCTCCSRGKTLGFGIAFFISGIFGFAAIFFMTFKIDVLLCTPVNHLKFGWAYPLFLVGNCIIFFSSVGLCFFSPGKILQPYETVLNLEHSLKKDGKKSWI